MVKRTRRFCRQAATQSAGEQMGLAGAAVADEHDGLGALDVAALGQLANRGSPECAAPG